MQHLTQRRGAAAEPGGVAKASQQEGVQEGAVGDALVDTWCNAVEQHANDGQGASLRERHSLGQHTSHCLHTGGSKGVRRQLAAHPPPKRQLSRGVQWRARGLYNVLQQWRVCGQSEQLCEV